MSDAIDRWTDTAALFSDRLGSVVDSDWGRPTPCSEWDVRALVDHATGTQVGFGSMLGLAAPDPLWEAVQRAMAQLLATPGAVAGTVTVPGLGDMTKEQILDICTFDLLIHTWDLSRAIGGDERLPESLVKSCMDWLQALPVEVVRSPGRFTAAVDVGPDASLQARMLAYAGRTS
jgi:uncharacterized protein (TIGR03086 family)